MASQTPITETPESQSVDVEKASPVAEETSDPEPEYPNGKRLALILIANALAMFLVALDRTIIATAVPRITDEFHSLADVGWYASAYLITGCATQLIWGRVYTFYSSKTVYFLAIAFFEIGSVVCGAAPHSNAFIVGRAVAGMGSAGIYSGAVIIISQVVPLHKRPIFVGMMGSIFGISSIIGPLLGGVFADKVTWRWCFYINLPVGAVTFVILVFILHLAPVKPVSLREQITRLDPLGTLVFLPGIVCFLLALQWGGSAYPWNDTRVIALFVLAGVLLSMFVGIQIWKKENATVPPRIFTQRSIACAVVYSISIGGAMITLVYYIPLWFQAVKGTNAVQSGIDNLPFVLALVVAAIMSGALITRTGWYNPFLFACSILMSIGAGLLTTFQIDTSSPKWIGYQVIFGFGLGLGMQQAGLVAQAVLARKDVSTGVSLMFFSQSLGGAIFVCIAQSVFTNNLVSNLSLIPGVDTALVLRTGATDLWGVISSSNLPRVLSVYNAAIIKAFTVALAMSCFSILPALGVEWKNVKGLKQGGPPVKKPTESVKDTTGSKSG